MTLKNGTILLAVMYVTKDGKKYHRKFPHVLGLDFTHGTNAAERPLFRATGKTFNNNNIPHVNCMCPCEQMWIIDWCVKSGLPSILDADALKKTCIIITDQDMQMVGVLMAELRLGESAIYGEALNRLCGWHKEDRGHAVKVKPLVKTDADRVFTAHMVVLSIPPAANNAASSNE